MLFSDFLHKYEMPLRNSTGATCSLEIASAGTATGLKRFTVANMGFGFGLLACCTLLGVGVW